MRYFVLVMASVGLLFVGACCNCGGGGSSDWSGEDLFADTCFQTVPVDKTNAGDTFEVSCPADCTFGSVWGSNPYTGDSNICSAAIHAGKIQTSGGSVKVKIVEGKEEYKGSEANGITSSDWGSYSYSFTFE